MTEGRYKARDLFSYTLSRLVSGVFQVAKTTNRFVHVIKSTVFRKYSTGLEFENSYSVLRG